MFIKKKESLSENDAKILEEIIDICELHDYNFEYKNKDDCSIPILYDLFVKSQIDNTNTDVTYVWRVGIYYYYFEEDFPKAKQCWLYGYDKDHSNSICELGMYYEKKEKKYEKAKVLYKYLAEKNNTRAMNLLGWHYYVKWPHTKTFGYVMAKNWWDKVLNIDDKNIDAMFGLVSYYSKMKNWESMKDLLYRITQIDTYKHHIGRAYHYLGWHYEFNNEEKNIRMYLDYYYKAIEYGNSNAMNAKALICEKTKDYKNAIMYYEMAIKKGNAIAMNNLGQFNFKIEKNYEKASEYFLNSIKAKNPSICAYYNLGVLYDEIYKKEEISQQYFLLAYEKGYTDALDRLTLSNRMYLNCKNMSSYFSG